MSMHIGSVFPDVATNVNRLSARTGKCVLAGRLYRHADPRRGRGLLRNPVGSRVRLHLGGPIGFLPLVGAPGSSMKVSLLSLT
jgi:hypothetical protein